MCLGGTKQHAVRYDAGTLATLFEDTQKQCQKQKLCLFGVGDCLEVIVDAFGIDSALKRRICQADGVFLPNLILLGHTVHIAHIRVGDRVQHQVHRRDAQHGAVHIKAAEGIGGKVLPLLRGHGILVVFADILRRRHQKSRCTTGRVTDHIVRCRCNQLHHHFANLLWCAELSVLACCCQFAQHILIQITLHIQTSEIMFI